MDCGFRINCDLSNFYSDARRKSRIFVNTSKDVTIKHLCQKIRNAFNISPDITIFVDGFYVAESEDIRVLSENNTIKVIDSAFNHLDSQVQLESREQIGDETQKKKRKKFKKSKRFLDDDQQQNNNPELLVDNNHSLLETSLEGDAESSNNQVNCSTPVDYPKESRNKKRKRVKKEKELNASANAYLAIQPSLNAESDQLITNNNITLKRCEDLHMSNKKSDIAENGHLQIATSHSYINNGTKPLICDIESSHNRKRKRVRKRRKDKNIKENEDMLLKGLPQDYTNATYAQNHTILPSNVKHLRFSNEQHVYHDLYHKEYDAEPINVQKTSLNHDNDQESQNLDVDVNLDQVTLGFRSEISPDSVLENKTNDQPFAKILALAETNPVVVKRFKTPMTVAEEVNLTDKNTSDKNTTSTESITLINDNINLANNAIPTPFKGKPQVDDVITFKILKLDQYYCPQISGLITAKVLEYCPDSQQTSFKVIGGHEHCEEPKGKFSNDYDPEEEQNEKIIVDIIHLNWEELIEPCSAI